ncbi:MAG: AEC family transporter [Rhodocyclaceae bacterium]
MQTLLHHISLAAPLFILVLIGYALVRWGRWPKSIADALTRFVFSLALPALLFSMMSDFSNLPPVDARLLIAFFGSCLIVFAVGRALARYALHLDGVSGSIFALGGVFSNNVLLGLPLARVTLGEDAVPSVALVLVFNSLILWTLVTVSVEWARHGSLSVHGFAKTAFSVITNPIVAAIVSGTLYGLTGLPLPTIIAAPLTMIASAAAPMALLALGMGLATYPVRQDWHLSVSICAIKLVLQPMVVWLLARALGLPKVETQVVVLLASIAVGANVYLMARQFKALEGPIAASLVMSTALAAITTPVVLTLTGL